MSSDDALAFSMCNSIIRRALLREIFRDRLNILTENAFGAVTQELADDGNENPVRVMTRNNFDRIFQAFALDQTSNDQNLQLLISLLGRDFVAQLPMTTYRVGSIHSWEGLLNRLIGYIGNNEQSELSTAWALTIAPAYNHNDLNSQTIHDLAAILAGMLVRFLLLPSPSLSIKR